MTSSMASAMSTTATNDLASAPHSVRLAMMKCSFSGSMASVMATAPMP